jgi:hypothetical protein
MKPLYYRKLASLPNPAAPTGGVRGDGPAQLGNPCADVAGRAGGARGVYFGHMAGIILEGVLFVALLATLATLLFHFLVRWTPLGLRLRQNANRRQIEQSLELECPIHGPQREEEMVRLPSGSRICPVCYKEALHE